MPSFSEKSLAQLRSCDPKLQMILKEVIQHIDVVVLEGHRDQAQQEDAFLKGATKLHWPHGKHNADPSRAVDIAPYLPDVKIDWKDIAAFGRLMGYIQRVADEFGIKLRFGMDWDGDFRTLDESFVDAPHVELVE